MLLGGGKVLGVGWGAGGEAQPWICCAQELLTAKADPTVKNGQNKTPLQVATASSKNGIRRGGRCLRARFPAGLVRFGG